jgi:hypothetical protein
VSLARQSRAGVDWRNGKTNDEIDVDIVS